MAILKEFKKFILKGNAFDLAVGVIIGGAFALVVKSMVDNIIMPIIGGLLKLPDFSNMFYAFDGKDYNGSLDAAREGGGSVLAHGVFINNMINLVVVGFALFMAIKFINRVFEKEEEKKKEEKPAEPSNEEKLLAEIRDLLKGDASEKPVTE